MLKSLGRGAAVAEILGLLVSATIWPALAGIEEYEFKLASEAPLPQGEEGTVAVKLIHKPTGEAVSDAVIFARRIDMAPDGMPTMTADLEPLPPKEPGVYTFRTTLGMAGMWQLSLAAKVQGVGGTLQSKLMLKARE
jgi:hypothetical protein